MRNFFLNHDFFVKTLIIFALLAVAGNLGYLDYQLLLKEKSDDSSLSSSLSLSNTETKNDEEDKETKEVVVDQCGQECKKYIDDKVAEVIASLPTSSPAKTVVQTQVIQKPSSQTSVVSIGSQFSTTATDWTDVKAGEVYIDKKDYRGSPTVTWQASLKVAPGTGVAFARLFDVTNAIAVDGSEISASSNDYTQVSSGNLPFWDGNNLYRVQVKSLNSLQISFDAGKIKLVSN